MRIIGNKKTYKVSYDDGERVIFYRSKSDPVWQRGEVWLDNVFLGRAKDLLITRYYGFMDPAGEEWAKGYADPRSLRKELKK